MQDNLDQSELQQFSSISDKWRDEKGPFAPLHAMNPVRLEYITSQIFQHFGLDERQAQDRKKFDKGRLSPHKILDVACGGGLVCEPLTRLGANVTGVDADQQAITVAQNHAELEKLDITYEVATAEDYLQTTTDKFDVVLGLEIIGHIPSPESFVSTLMGLAAPNWLIIFSTLNRTAKSCILAKIGAEYILNWLPRGTHDWRKFVKPSELASLIRKSGGIPLQLKGISYNPFNREFSLSDDKLDMNYIMTATRK